LFPPPLVVHAQPACDRKQPRLEAPRRPIAVQVPVRPNQGVLDEVFGVFLGGPTSEKLEQRDLESPRQFLEAGSASLLRSAGKLLVG
jgi:hypothetical protein